MVTKSGTALFQINSPLWVLLLLLTHFALYSAVILPLPHQIAQAADEAVLANAGRLIIENRPVFIPLFGYPLVTYIYAVINLLVREDMYWLLSSLWIGRSLFFILLWLLT